MIAAGKKSEQKSNAAQTKLKLEYPPVARQFALIAPDAYHKIHGREDLLADRLGFKPLLPPPRSLTC
jgi:hypothetical protein